MQYLITGAGSGLGRSLCQLLAGPEATIFATDLNAQAAAETAALVEKAGFACHWAELDVTSTASIEQLFAAQPSLRPDVLINNAGLQHVAKLEEFPAEQWGLLIDVMLKGAALASQAALPRMRSAGFGRIVNIGSIHSLVASPFKSAYVAAKHGLIGLSKTLALETGDVDITVNTICPSYIHTPLVERQIAQQALVHNLPEQQVIDTIMLRPMPKKQFITVEEVAYTVRFLSGDLARNITGQTIVLDGGWTAQ
jgi:3-hydroxybutyrate dehydrogenase